MSVAAGRAAMPVGQLAVAGLGALCILNPDKFFMAVQRGTQTLFISPANQGRSPSQQPIIIHQGTHGLSKSMTGTMVQLVLGAGVCWGSYALLANVLPEAVKEMLPVTNSVFNRAVTSLGKAVVNLKDTLMEQVLGLSQKQEELNEKQEKTHGEVLVVKENVADLKGDLGLVQESLDLCHATLSESERRTSYIARGVQLLTRGVGTFLPKDDKLMSDLIQFHTAGEEFNKPAQLNQLRQVLTSLHLHQNQDPAKQHGVQKDPKTTNSPENEVPNTPSEVEKSVLEVRALLDSVRCYG